MLRLEIEGSLLVPASAEAPYDVQQCGILKSVYSDEPVQLSVKLRNSK